VFRYRRCLYHTKALKHLQSFQHPHLRIGLRILILVSFIVFSLINKHSCRFSRPRVHHVTYILVVVTYLPSSLPLSLFFNYPFFLTYPTNVFILEFFATAIINLCVATHCPNTKSAQVIPRHRAPFLLLLTTGRDYGGCSLARLHTIN
jgi:hypothetical protein